MARQPKYALRPLSGSLAAAALGGRAFLLASPNLYLLPSLGEQRRRR